VQNVVNQLSNISLQLVRMNRAAQLYFEEPAVKDLDRTRRLKQVRGAVVFDDVSFAYSNGEAVLRDVTFEVPAGKTVALVGESGAGKSTLAQMMTRFHDPIEGAVKIDGVDIREMKLEFLRKHVGFVMQDNMLFHDSILDNIRFAKPGASKDAVIRAARKAQAHDFIKTLKGGYDTIVGERGVKLSGGQKQRIALARVFLADPPVLVLDEATSALDSKTEHALQAALEGVMKDRTTIVIAHRLSTVMGADEILVMDKGRVVDRGTHAQLIRRKDGLYKEYWKIQAGGYM